jgi:hypothetical protein
MTRKPWLVPVTLVLLAVAWAAPKGTVPRSSAAEYPAHAQQNGIDVGARLLTPSEVRKTFVSDLNRCCVVLELAVFPKAEKPFMVSVDDLTLRVAGKETILKASSATVVSAALQRDAQQQRDVSVVPGVNVGYQSGPVYDPATGTARGGGVYTGAGVGIGVGQRGNQPGASEKDRSVIETELTEKGLPEGESASPVAGYIYFQISRSKDAKYQLQYKLNGNLMQIDLK